VPDTVTNNPAQPRLGEDDAAIVQAIRQGDERAFTELVERCSGIMLRLALAHVSNHAVAEEVVQDAWLTVLRSLDRFEGRSSLRTWILGIVVNLARSRGRAERRNVPLPDDAERAVDPQRFLPADHPRWPHHWAIDPIEWRTPEAQLLDGETRRVILDAISALPAAQREVVMLRDVDGLAAGEVCHILNLNDTHQRVLLHRARSRVRAAIERYFAGTEAR
jgi:RNA polymerase sigma-70 factor, ECF subfamily